MDKNKLTSIIMAKKNAKQLLLKKYKNRCQICYNCLRAKDLTIDHIIKKAEGGSDDISNLQILCRPCHDIKDGVHHGYMIVNPKPNTKRNKKRYTQDYYDYDLTWK